MEKYKVEDLHEGMVVGESVFDENSKLLIAAGFSLGKKHIAAFKKKGISADLLMWAASKIQKRSQLFQST